MLMIRRTRSGGRARRVTRAGCEFSAASCSGSAPRKTGYIAAGRAPVIRTAPVSFCPYRVSRSRRRLVERTTGSRFPSEIRGFGSPSFLREGKGDCTYARETRARELSSTDVRNYRESAVARRPADFRSISEDRALCSSFYSAPLNIP